jgi:hypothetical protein
MTSDADERVKRAAADKLDSGMRWLLRREIEQLPRLLPEGEEIELLAQGRLDGGTGMIVVTGRRLLFLDQGDGERATIGRVYPKAMTMEIADYVRVHTSAPGDPGHTLGRQPGSA